MKSKAVKSANKSKTMKEAKVTYTSRYNDSTDSKTMKKAKTTYPDRYK